MRREWGGEELDGMVEVVGCADGVGVERSEVREDGVANAMAAFDMISVTVVSMKVKIGTALAYPCQRVHPVL